jgi:sulfate adenylyltransferase subunit 2
MADLKLLFRQSGVTQRDIAAAVGRSEAAISQWVRGERDIPADLVPQIEALTGIARHRLRPDLWEKNMDAVTDAARQADLTHLQRLEAESIHIMREVAAEAEHPVMLYSVGKDSAVMLHLAMKAFAPGRPPFPLLHVNTTWKFREMIEFRDRMVRENGLNLIEWINHDGIARGMNPFDHGNYTDVMKTDALKAALDHYGFDAAFGGARRDEEKSRANARKNKGESIRAFPISNWTELDIWQYIHLENIPIVPLYFAAERPVVTYNGLTIMVDDDRMRIPAGQAPRMEKIRFRTLGCYPLTGATHSEATTLPQIIQEMLLTTTSERQGRAIDHDQAASMEKKKQEGYF